VSGEVERRSVEVEMGQLSGKTALVTGGSTGIGFATAARFVAEGAEVVITGRRQAELDKAADELGEHVTAVRGDVSDLADLDRLYAAIEARGTGLDVLFANAGGGAFARLEELTPEQFDSTFSINVRGTVFTVQKALPLLNPGASVIVTGSTSASRGTPAFGVYSASKARRLPVRPRLGGRARRTRHPGQHDRPRADRDAGSDRPGRSRRGPGPDRRRGRPPDTGPGRTSGGDRERCAVPRLGPVQLHDRQPALPRRWRRADLHRLNAEGHRTSCGGEATAPGLDSGTGLPPPRATGAVRRTGAEAVLGSSTNGEGPSDDLGQGL
jgi:heptaprenylglyceryl phosphate synthase